MTEHHPNAIEIYQDPLAMEAVRLYTDPLLPTFGSKRASALAAGCERSVFNRVAVIDEIDRIIQHRLENSEKTVEFMATYSMDAARELIGHLSAGRDLEFIPMEEIRDSMRMTKTIGEGEDAREVEVWSDGKLLASIVRHNGIVLAAYEQRRKAAVELIRQQIGTPEQRIKVDHGNKEELPQLTDLPDDQLEELGQFISNALEERRGEKTAEVEAEWTECPTEGESG